MKVATDFLLVRSVAVILGNISLSHSIMAEAQKPMSLDDDGIRVELTEKHLDVMSTMNRVRSPKAGAIVFFAGVFGA